MGNVRDISRINVSESYKELFEFICKTNGTDIIRGIYTYQCERLFQQYICFHNVSSRERFSIINAEQAMRNSIFREEIKNLSRAFDEHGLPLIHLKGISLLDDLYCFKDAHMLRKINDIDILISFEYLEESLDLLGELEYYVISTGKRVSKQILQDYLQTIRSRNIHFPEFGKMVINEGALFVIKMDCHISLFHTNTNKEQIMKKIVSRCEKRMLGKQTINVLELHDRIIHLIAHFTKEVFRCHIRWYLTGERCIDGDYGIRLPLLLDIALLIDKYKDNINWNIILERAMELYCQDEVFAVLSLMKEIFYHLRIDEKIYSSRDNEKLYFHFKYSGMFYALKWAVEDPTFILYNTFSKISERIIHQSRRNDFFVLKEEYYIADTDATDFIIGHQISRRNVNSIGKIYFDLDDEYLIIILLGEKLVGAASIYVTVATEKRSSVLKGYINKFWINLINNEDLHSICHISNAYVDCNLKNNVFLNKNDRRLLVRLPKSLLGIDDCTDVVLIDIGLPEVQKKKDGLVFELEKYGINDIGKRGLGKVYHCSPNLLSTIYLKSC